MLVLCDKLLVGVSGQGFRRPNGEVYLILADITNFLAHFELLPCQWARGSGDTWEVAFSWVSMVHPLCEQAPMQGYASAVDTSNLIKAKVQCH